jgi:hypothetical protein
MSRNARCSLSKAKKADARAPAMSPSRIQEKIPILFLRLISRAGKELFGVSSLPDKELYLRRFLSDQLRDVPNLPIGFGQECELLLAAALYQTGPVDRRLSPNGQAIKRGDMSSASSLTLLAIEDRLSRASFRGRVRPSFSPKTLRKTEVLRCRLTNTIRSGTFSNRWP